MSLGEMTYTLYRGDCLTEMDKIADKSIDAIIADLPYGTTACSWDTVIPFEPLWAHFKRVIKDRGAVVLFGSQPFTSALILSNLEWFRYQLYWKKSRSLGFFHAKNKPLNIVEDIPIFSPSPVAHESLVQNAMKYNPQMRKGRPYVKMNYAGRNSEAHKFNRKSHVDYLHVNDGERYPDNFIEFSNGNNFTVHPTQKPIELMEYLVKTYTNPGDTVLDCTMGSGTTGAACGRLNRRFIGTEQDAGYFEIAENRIKNAYGDFVRTPEEVKRGGSWHYLRAYLMLDPRSKRAIINLATQTVSGRFFILNADVFQQNMLGLKRPVLSSIRSAVCVATSADSTGRFAFRGD